MDTKKKTLLKDLCLGLVLLSVQEISSRPGGFPFKSPIKVFMVFFLWFQYLICQNNGRLKVFESGIICCSPASVVIKKDNNSK